MGNLHFFKSGVVGRRENKHKIKSRQEGNISIIETGILLCKSFEQQKLDVQTPLKDLCTSLSRRTILDFGTSFDRDNLKSGIIHRHSRPISHGI